jgi:nucleoside-diphosphate-sugar epimerase
MEPIRRKVLITGASGRIGLRMSERVRDLYDLRLMTHGPGDSEVLTGHGELVAGDLGDLAGLKKLCQGIDTVVHLAGTAHPASIWSELLPNNIVGTYNLLVAAKSQGCRRVILASSIHAVSGYARDVQVKTSDPVNPGDLYGVTKCFMEALGRYMAEKEGLSVITIRIGACDDIERAQSGRHVANMDAFVSKDDLIRLVVRCIDDEAVHYALVHAVSDNAFKRLDMSDTNRLFASPMHDDFAAEHPILKPLRLSERLSSHSEVSEGGLSGIREDLAN